MTLGSILLAWASGYASTFLLGFQSRNVNAGRYGAAACTSSIIAIAQAWLWHDAAKFAPLAFILIYGTAGPVGIVTAIWASHRMFGKRI